MSIIVSELDGTATAALPVEIVERKGLGHPDTICDALAEEVSRALSRFYRQRFGFILHHNVDKVLLRGGVAAPAFGGGEVREPIEIYLAGRATREYRGVDIPIDEIAINACKSWLSENLHALTVADHVHLHCLIRPGSSDLVELFERQRGLNASILANDTSIGVGYAPLTPLETAVLAAEKGIRAPLVSAFGEDIKVMAVRTDEQTSLTVACALVGRYLQDMDAYLAAKGSVADRVRTAVGSILGSEVIVEVNAADDPESGSVYLTVTGTSAEGGDDGQTGRGNRANGLITPARPMTIESLAGKNPITHTGKIYNVVATQIAQSLVSQLQDVLESHVVLVSRIGSPVEAPDIMHVRLRTDGRPVGELETPVLEIARDHLARIGLLWEQLLLRNLAAEGIAST